MRGALQASSRPLRIPFRRGIATACLLAASWAFTEPAALARPQDSVAVMVDESPTATQLAERMLEQRQANVGESARIAARLLAEFGDRLVPDPERGDGAFRSVRAAVEAALATHPDLLGRYRELAETDASERLAAGDLEGLHREALFTAAGLEATLRLAQLDVERGLASQALRRLHRIDAHPDLEGEALRRAAAIEALARWVEGEADESPLGTPPPARVAADPLGPGDDEASISPEWRRMWSVELPDSPFRRAFRELQQTGRLVPRTATRIAEEGNLLVALPSADGDTIYLNEGHVARAIDRLSRRERWRVALEDGEVTNLGAVGDPTLVAVSEGIAVTIAGHAIGTVRTGVGRIVAIDAADGSIRWRAKLVGDGEDADLFPYGVPVIAGDSVLTLARRVTNRLESVDYLACLALEDGSRRWISRLGSSGGIRLGGMRPFSIPLVADGLAFVASSVGVVAAVEIADGEIAWLRRMPVPLRDTRLSVEPWEVQRPLAIGEAIHVIAPDQASILRLDGATGEELARRGFEDGAIGQPRYLLSGRDREGRDVLIAVGSDIAALDPRDLSSPRWRFSEVDDARRSERSGLVNRLGIRGRAQVAGDLLLVPGREDILALDLATGEEIGRVEIEEPANLLQHDGQIVLAAKDSLVALMPPDRARARLAERRRAEPENPEWPLASVELEFAAGDVEAALAAAEDALVAVERSQSADERERLFAELLAIDAALPPSDLRIARSRTLLASTALTPSQRIREALTRGDWHAANGRLGEAMEAWQSILSDASLLREPLASGGTEVLAAAAARERMRRLAAVAGPEVLAPSEALAAIRLDRARRDGASAETLLAIAREFPLSDAAAAARLEAARRLEGAGEPREALLVLLEGVRDGGGDRRSLRDAMVAASLRQDWLESAQSSIESGGSVPSEDASFAEADRWARLGPRDPEPRLGPGASEGRSFLGRLVPFADRTARPRDRVLIAGDGLLSMRESRGGELEERWIVPIEDPLPTILAFGESILVWQLADRDRPMPMRIDARTGRIEWVNPSVAELFTAIDPATPHPLEGQRPAPGATEPWRASELLPLVVEDGLVLVRRDGEVACLDLEDGRTVRWSTTAPLEAVFQVDAGPLGVVLAGRGRDDAGNSVPATVWIDPEGQVRRRWLGSEQGDARWVRLSPLGEIAWGDAEGVEVRSIAAGDGAADGRWRSIGPWARNTWDAWLLGDRLLLRQGDDRLEARHLADGGAWREASAYETPRREGPLTVFGGMWRDRAGVTALYGDRVVRFGSEGELAGIDAVSEDRNFLLATRADDELVVLSFRGAGPTTDAEGTPRTEFVYAVYRFGLSDGLRQRGPALEIRTLGPRFDAIGAIDGWLLLSSPTSSVAVPLR
ncbi:MAG: PQQ-binding-like beta-propeller repeat protein [Phycisphaerales bacterium]